MHTFKFVLHSILGDFPVKNRFFFLLNVALVLSLFPASPAAAKDNQRGLQPGEFVTYEQNVPINIVFIGYPRDTIDKEQMLDVLPESYAPVVRYPQFYGLQGRDMGLSFEFEYQVTFAGQDLTNRFFRYLTQVGTVGEPTDFQGMYNDQENNVLDVTSPVLYIDAPSVEKWLARHIEKEKGYTIVFINWYSRPDFSFHVYTKTDEPDLDTGYNFGEIRESRKMIAWGGGNSRLWFYDLSAGPEAWTDNWNVDTPDLDENGAEDYRMPPIWEYDEDGYRDPSALSYDLGLVTRFVGINLLFTASPLYDPMATAPGPGGNRVVHINMFEDDPDSVGSDFINTGGVTSEFENFQPYYDWEVNVVNLPLEGEALRAFRIFAGLDTSEDCWSNFGTPFAQLFCYFDLHRAIYIPEYNEDDYVDRNHSGRDENLVFGRQFNAKADCRSSKLLIRLAGIRSCLPVLPLVEGSEGGFCKVIRDLDPFPYLVSIGMRLDLREQGIRPIQIARHLPAIHVIPVELAELAGEGDVMHDRVALIPRPDKVEFICGSIIQAKFRIIAIMRV